MQYKVLRNGFERYRFVHRALPEIDKREVDTGAVLLGRSLKAPVVISAMTGGTDLSARINRHLAAAAQALGLAFGVGSQRAAIEDPSVSYSYQVRDVAPDVLLLANLGAVQLNHGYGVKECIAAVEMIGADALVLHLNALQECIQPEGNTDFSNLLPKLAAVCAQLSVPVIVKEVGCGISDEVARELVKIGVAAIDVAGAGGTSWVSVEKHRSGDERTRLIADTFGEWGIPTAESLRMVKGVAPDVPVIASGGIRNGLEIAKALALGADCAGIAEPTLRPATLGVEAVVRRLSLLIEELGTAMFCVGARSVDDLRKARLEKV